MKPLEERKKMIEKDNDTISQAHQCDLLSLHRSSIYYQPVPEREENLTIMRFLDEQYFSTPFYGVERLLPLLQRKCYQINIKRLRRLMRLLGWQTLYPTKRTTVSDKKSHKYPYLLDGLPITKSNQVWEIDITYIPMQRGFMYLFAIIDVYSLYVISWSLSNTMNTEWCVDTIKQAITIHGVPQIINSDQGSQFTSDLYIQYLESQSIHISMDSKGRALDNIFIERLWRSVKYEYVYLNACTDGNELWKGLNEYFRFYNKERLHQNLDYLTPEEVYYGKKIAA